MFHCRSDAIRGDEAGGLREQDTEGRDGEAGREGARPVSTGRERQSGMFDPCCGERCGARVFSTAPDSRAARWEGRLSR